MEMVTFLPFSSGKEGAGEEDVGEEGGDGPQLVTVEQMLLVSEIRAAFVAGIPPKSRFIITLTTIIPFFFVMDRDRDRNRDIELYRPVNSYSYYRNRLRNRPESSSDEEER